MTKTSDITIYSYPHERTAKNSDSEIMESVRKHLSERKMTVPAVSVHRDSYGKPHISGCDGIYVSVAHDGELCLVAVADFPIGIDLERESRKVRSPIGLAGRYFCPDEAEFLESSPTDRAFLELWVKKEALSKLIGKGVSCMKEKSIFADDVLLEEHKDYAGYVVYTARYVEK